MGLDKEHRWKRIIDADVLCDSYSQRVFASFGLLDSFTKGYFTLDDFVERGLIVEEFLSLNVNTRTLFHVMDSFREFDVDGNGIVPIEEFVEKVMEKLDSFSEDTSLIEESASKLMPSGNKTVNEMVLLLRPEKQMNTDSKIAAFIHIIEEYLEKFGVKHDITFSDSSSARSRDAPGQDVGSSLLKEMIRAAIKNSILELARRFHFKRKAYTYLTDNYFASILCNTGDDGRINVVSKEQSVKPSFFGILDQYEYRNSKHHDEQSFLNNAVNEFFDLLSKPRCKWRRLRKFQLYDQDITDSPFSSKIRAFSTESTLKVDSTLASKALTEEFDLSQLYILHRGVYEIKKILRDFGVTANSSLPIPELSQLTVSDKIVKSQNVIENEECETLSNYLSRQLSVAQFKLLQSEVRLKMFSTLQMDINGIFNNGNRVCNLGESCENIDTINVLSIQGLLTGNTLYEDCIHDEDVDEEESLKTQNGNNYSGAAGNTNGDTCTVDDIMQEIFKLKGCAAFRGKESSFLGHSLASSTGALYFSFEKDGEIEGMEQSRGNFDRPKILSRDNVFKFEDLLTSYIMSINSFVKSPRNPSSLWNLISCALPDLSISSTGISAHAPSAHYSSHDATSSVILDGRKDLHPRMLHTDVSEDAETSIMFEQAGDNREAVMHMAVELQLLREKLTRSNIVFENESRRQNDEESRKILDSKINEEFMDDAHKNSGIDAIYEMDNVNLREENKKALQINTDLTSKIFRLELENRRLSTNIGQTGANMSKALQENLALRQKITRLEDNNAAAVLFQGHLQDDILHERSLREDREFLFSRVQELERNLSLTQNNLLELKEENRQLQKLKEELELTENRVSEMTDEISMLSMHNERADLAMQQVEEYRSQLREHARLDRERALYIHKLELEAREAQLFRTRNIDLSEEIQVYKSKVEKFPAFLAESARLRACNKAVFKSLNEHDKSSVSSAARTKELEREILRLKSENKMYQHTEKKLKDANLDYKHLSEVIGGLSLKEKNEGPKSSPESSSPKMH